MQPDRPGPVANLRGVTYHRGCFPRSVILSGEVVMEFRGSLPACGLLAEPDLLLKLRG
jgi:hypothetical protein